MRAVQFTEYGGIDVLHVADIDRPEPDADGVLIEVRAAGTNPGEAAIRQGAMAEVAPSTFPSGQGSDLAGVVVEVGSAVTDVSPGDEVLGFSWTRSSQAQYAVVPQNQLVAKPAALSWEVAGALYVVGVTAYAAVRAVDAASGDTVVVSAAAGGVGSMVVQLLTTRGAKVIGLASEANHEWLRSKGVIPVAYGGDLANAIRRVSDGRVDALIDLFGPDYLRLAVDLGVAPDRTETIIAFEEAGRRGMKAEGSQDASTPEVLAEVAELVASGQVELPIAATYPLDRVQDAYRELEQRHTHGKIVLLPQE
ncbi:NADP-dependent oxidoreductase [uncultured Jatrophihabitans sp.]|uniref:NADP-dependent oxidoreductase n=1 Tax=uncultured Jatrophihabitans sp. TaxID=1610747 RepID=UPI0035CB2EEB